MKWYLHGTSVRCVLYKWRRSTEWRICVVGRHGVVVGGGSWEQGRWGIVGTKKVEDGIMFDRVAVIDLSL
jgi:hypothetical protein